MDERLKAAGLLFASNTFMTVAWYGHLRFKNTAAAAVGRDPEFSWGIALFEYILQVPANRIGVPRDVRVPAEGHAGGDHAGGCS